MQELTDQQPQTTSSLYDRVGLALVLIYQIVALACLIAVPILAYQWLRLPYIGGFVEHSLVVNTTRPTQAGADELQNIALPLGYRVSAIDGIETTNVHRYREILGQYHVGETVNLLLISGGGSSQNLNVHLRSFPMADRINFLLIPYFVSFVLIASSLWVFASRRWDSTGRALVLFTCAVGIVCASWFDTYTTNALVPLWICSLGITGGALLNLTLVFPDKASVANRYPALTWLVYLPGMIVAGITLPTTYNLSEPYAYLSMWRILFILVVVSGLVFLARTVLRGYSAPSPFSREQARVVLWGAAISLIPMVLGYLLSVLQPEIQFSAILFISLAIMPLFMGYAIVSGRHLNPEFMFSRVVLYSLLTILAVTSYVLIVFGASIVLGEHLPANQPVFIGMVVFVFAILLNPVRTRLQNGIDRFFLRNRANYSARALTFGQELSTLNDREAILERLCLYIDQDINPTHLHIFTRDPSNDNYSATPGLDGVLTTELRFAATSPVAQMLDQKGQSIHLGRSSLLPSELQSEQSRLALLESRVLVPVPGRQRLLGWLDLDLHRSGKPYNPQEINYLEDICAQAGVALERAEVVLGLQRRVTEMDAITRVAHGVSVTIAFDDILELIYAQTIQVLPTTDFRITLTKGAIDTQTYAFYLENEERLREREGVIIPSNEGLDGQVIEKRRPLRTNDYDYECRQLGIIPNAPGIFAWMGVPLNAGAETIGAISLGSRDLNIIYSEHQQELLKAIADQAAGAIVKAQLLEETERRARQLATLNEIGLSLTSTLALKPLLNQILVSAVEILDCEAGTLFMVDDQTGELIFEVAVGTVADDLIGRRMPPGTGIVGRCASTGKPHIANDVRKRPDWSDTADRETGFTTRDILVAPMNVKEITLGVIELINKRDLSHFSNADQELLTTFASQAAIALENARLYTQTDEALSARVEEMTVMQRIDRELNASLDIQRVMQLTLDWAIRQSKAVAGLIGLFDYEGERQINKFRVIAARGYENQNFFPESQDDPGQTILWIPVDQLHFVSVFQEAKPQLSIRAEEYDGSAISERNTIANIDGSFFLATAIEQLVIPIRRQNDVIGFLILESETLNTFKPETITFLGRLSDHAAIAISNAQLFADLQAANIAKSDFVSLVSHELKTPMTSIKGYADLLVQGSVGPVSETQTMFLNTIRSNVNRMATLVSDLADISRIEADRLRLEFKAVDILPIIEEVVRSAQAQIDEKEQTLTLQTAPDLPVVWADRNRLIQIMANLISNATKYTPEKNSITITAERITNQWDPDGAPEVVKIAVVDTGYGIADEDKPKIFQKFFRAEDQNIRNAPGTGLGLNITRHLVNMQGGKIWFESQLDQGTTFYFTIPLAQMAE